MLLRILKHRQIFYQVSWSIHFYSFTDISTKHLLWYAINKQAVCTCSRGIPYSHCQQRPQKALQGHCRTAADRESLCRWVLFSTDSGVTEVSILWEWKASLLCGLLVYKAMWSCKWLLLCKRNMPHILRKWWQYVPPKCQWICTRLHGITSQKGGNFLCLDVL